MTTNPRRTFEGANWRKSSRAKFWNRVDPVYLLLDRLVFAPFFDPHLPGVEGPSSTIEVAEVKFLIDNIRKHRAIIWANVLALAAIVKSGLPRLANSDLQLLIPGLAATVIVSGIAWYSISFSGVPERFGRHAMLVTGVLFLAVSFSLTTLFVVLGAVTPTAVAATVLAPIYVALYVAAVFYDNLDGLRATASQGAIVFSRAQTYASHSATHATDGSVSARSERLQIQRDLNAAGAGEQAAEIFNELIIRLERLLETLADRQPPMIANVLIADCLNDVTRLLTLTAHPLTMDEEFLDLVAHAHEMSVDEVNGLAAQYIRVIVERIHAILGDSMAEEMGTIVERLGEIERIRADTLGERGDDSSLNRVQELADFLFVEVFRKLVSIIRANRSRLLVATVDGQS